MKENKSKLIFLRSIDSSEITWHRQLQLVAGDEVLKKRFESHIFTRTPLMEKGRFVDNLDELADNFHDWLFEDLNLGTLAINYQNRNSPQIIFVGHGLGGLLILLFIKKLLENNHNNKYDIFLRCLRQIILFGTPLAKRIKIENYLQKLYPTIEKNATNENFFFNLNKKIKEILDYIDLYVVNADEFQNHKWPIPIVLFRGTDEPSDQIIPSWFPKGAIKSIPGDLLNVILPVDEQDNRFKLFKNYLLDPIGHKKVFEIDEIIYQITVEPFHQAEKAITKYQGREVIKKVKCENKGVVSRSIYFSKTNICDDLFIIKYGTTNREGGIIPSILPSNLYVRNEIIEEYNKSALIFTFEFNPRMGQDYTFSVEAYKGFDGFDGQNAHFHLEKGTRYYNVKRIKLDLSKYHTENYQMIITPELYLMDEDTHNCAEEPRYRIPENSIPPTRADQNLYVWEWELFNIRSGVLDIVWNIEGIGNGLSREQDYEILEGKPLLLKESRIEREKFAELLLECATIQNRDRLNDLIKELHCPEIEENLDITDKPKLLVVDLIEESIRYHKLLELISILKQYEENDEIMSRVKRYLESPY